MVRVYVGIHPGVTKMVTIGDSDQAAVGTTSGAVSLVDVKQGGILKTLTGHTDTILSLTVTKYGCSLNIFFNIIRILLKHIIDSECFIYNGYNYISTIYNIVK